MNQREYREAIRDLLSTPVGKLTREEKTTIIRNLILESEKSEISSPSNRGKPWSDDELRVILSTSPTQENCLRLAKAFHRGCGSIEQIFRWAATPQKEINEKRPDDAFIAQIKRVAKEIGWIA